MARYQKNRSSHLSRPKKLKPKFQPDMNQTFDFRHHQAHNQSIRSFWEYRGDIEQQQKRRSSFVDEVLIARRNKA